MRPPGPVTDRERQHLRAMSLTRWGTDPVVRFWSRVTKGPGAACWTMRQPKGSNGRDGYPVMSIAKRHTLAHRYAWSLEHGPIPDGLDVCHHCDNPACVRPDHLFLGTHADNMADMGRKGRAVVPRGERHPAAKVTPAMVLEIRRARAAGVTCHKVGARFNLSTGQVSRIATGKYWRDVLPLPSEGEE